MRLIVKMLFAAAMVAMISTSASAQQQQGRTQQGQGGGLGGQVDLTSNLSDLTFSTSRSNGVAASNPLGGYYGNYAYMGRVGSTGITQGQYTGGFGQVLYSTGGSSGGMTGGAQSRTGGATGMSGGMTGAGGNFGGASTGATGRTGSGATSFGGVGTTGATGGSSFGGAASTMGGMGAQGGRMGQMGMGGMGMNSRMGGMGGGMQSANVVTGDRPIASLIGGGTGGILPRNAEPMFSRAQIQIRTVFDNTNQLASAKTIDISVNEAGIARLTGTVSSPDEKRLAAGLAQITPGVRMVVNELAITNP